MLFIISLVPGAPIHPGEAKRDCRGEGIQQHIPAPGLPLPSLPAPPGLTSSGNIPSSSDQHLKGKGETNNDMARAMQEAMSTAITSTTAATMAGPTIATSDTVKSLPAEAPRKMDATVLKYERLVEKFIKRMKQTRRSLEPSSLMKMLQ